MDPVGPHGFGAILERVEIEGLIMLELPTLDHEPAARPPRMSGDLKGQLQIPDDFDAPLPGNVEDSFYDSII